MQPLAAFAAAVVAAVSASGASAASLPLPPSNLAVEYLQNPRVLDTPTPRFFWVPQHFDRGITQQGYHIQVNTSGTTVVWDTGLVSSNVSTHIPYAGTAITSDTVYSWSVQWQDSNGAWSDWAEAASFGTGLLTQGEWNSQWITCPVSDGVNRNQLRTSFQLPALPNGVAIKQARLYVTGMGYYRAFINGLRLGQNELDPGWTTYPQRVLYNAYDVTLLLSATGENVLAAYVGNGWPNISPNPFNGSSSTATVASQWDGESSDGDGKTLHPLAQKRLAGAMFPRVKDATNAVRKFRAQLHVTTTDGSVYQLTTNAAGFGSVAEEEFHQLSRVNAADRSLRSSSSTAAPIPIASNWQCTAGALLYDDVYNGCTWNSLLETVGWDAPGYNTTGWPSAVLAADPGGANGPALLTAQAMQEVAIMQILHPRSVNEPEPGVYVLDFEQNFAGYVRLNLPAPFPGNVTITLRHAELLQHPPYGPQDGNIYVGNLRSALATEVYTTRQVDTGVLSLEPLFTYHGFRYVEIRGMPYPPVLDQVEGLYFRTGAPIAASLTFPAASANTLNQLQHAIQWGTGANLMSVQSDCPQRDERKGWMGDSGLSQEQTALNYDVCAFYTMWALNIQDSQVAKQYGHPEGAVPDTVPWTFGSDPGDPAWETAYPGVIWTMMRACGDLQLPAAHYSNLQAIIAFEASKANASGIGKMFSYYGDWCPPPAQMGGGQGAKPPGSLVSAAAYIHDISMAIDIANALGHSDDVASWTALRAGYVAGFNSAFFNAASSIYGNTNGDGLQSANAASLALGFVPAGSVAAVANALQNDLANTHQNHWSVGIFGMKYLWRALTANGFGETAIDALLVEGYPGFQFWFNNDLEPATTMNELPDMSAEGPSMNSRNHHMFASVGAYLFDLMGIQQAPGSNGWQHALIAPTVTSHPNLTYASGTKVSIAGQLNVDWQTGSPFQCINSAPENINVTLSCPGATSNVITNITFADFGTSSGSCTSGFVVDPTCSAANSTSIVRSKCVGQHTCTILVSDTLFGDPCYGTVKHFSATAQCAQEDGLSLQATVPANTRATVVLPFTGASARVSVTEGSTVVFANSAYQPGDAGVTGAYLVNNGTAVAVEVGSGSYSFVVA